MEFKEFFPLMYCINLDNRKDRWELANAEFERAGIHPQRFSAITHKYPPRGCYLSHLAILKEAEKQNKNVFIFEDDIEFIDIEKYFTKKALEDMENHYWWDMLYLGGNILKPFYKVSPYWAKLLHCQSTHAYGVNRYFVPKLINWLEKYSQNEKNILDVVYAETVVPYVSAYISIPMLAIQRTDYSDIEGREMTYDLPLKRYEHFLQERK